MNTADSDHLTTGSVSRVLARSESTVRQYDREGRLPSVRNSANQRLFRRVDVERLAQELRSRQR
jgi:DNA-binding transcriptional MerR regulator